MFRGPLDASKTSSTFFLLIPPEGVGVSFWKFWIFLQIFISRHPNVGYWSYMYQSKGFDVSFQKNIYCLIFWLIKTEILLKNWKIPIVKLQFYANFSKNWPTICAKNWAFIADIATHRTVYMYHLGKFVYQRYWGRKLVHTVF